MDRNIAHWYLDLRRYNEGHYSFGVFRCSNCKNGAFNSSRFPNDEYFCHSCGAAMIEVPKIKITDTGNYENGAILI